MSIFGIFYVARSPNMTMSRDPRNISQKFYSFLILHLILGKVPNFLVEKLSTSEVISQKPHGGGGISPSVLLGLKNTFPLSYPVGLRRNQLLPKQSQSYNIFNSNQTIFSH